MTVLLTGADGQLSHALRERLRGEHEVVALARADLNVTAATDVRACVESIRPAVIINGAAYNDVDGAEDDPVEALAVNAFAVRSLARAAVEAGATLVTFSTDFVFDGTAAEPYGEDAAPNPQSTYACSKLLGEWFARAARHYVVRVESLFGGGLQARPGGARGGSLDRMAAALLAGCEVRAFVDRTVSPSYVEDVAEAVAALLRQALPEGVYHCAGTGMASWLEVASELACQLGAAARIIPVRLEDVPLRARRPRFCALSNAKLARAGIRMPAWQDAVARYAARYLERA